MAREDEEKTAFITPCGVFCYVCMPFGLKNAGATFQRLMRKALGAQMGRNAEAYVDDIVVKTREERTLIEDLEETFANLRKVNIMLNPAKCVFGVPSGKLLGFLVSHCGIEANPDKIKAIEEMQPPRRLKDMQRLAGCMALRRRGGCISSMALILSGLASMPQCESKNPRSLPEGTPKTHLVGLSLMFTLRRFAKVSSRSVMRVCSSRTLTMMSSTYASAFLPI